MDQHGHGHTLAQALVRQWPKSIHGCRHASLKVGALDFNHTRGAAGLTKEPSRSDPSSTSHRNQPRREQRSFERREGASGQTTFEPPSIGAPRPSPNFPRSLPAEHSRIGGHASLEQRTISAGLPRGSASISKVWQHLWTIPVARRSEAVPVASGAAHPHAAATAIAFYTLAIFAWDVGVDVSLGATRTWLGL